MADDVQLTDLEVIQKYSLAVRGATASRDDVIAALEADLAFLGGRRPGRSTAPSPEPEERVAAKTVPARTAPARTVPAKIAPAKVARKAPAKAPAPVKTARSRKA